MKKVLLLSTFLVMIASCISIESYRPQTNNQPILGTISVDFMIVNPIHYPRNTAASIKAYNRLLDKAIEEYGENVDIVNINAEGDWHFLSLLPGFPHFSTFANIQLVVATGDVISRGQSNLAGEQNMNQALEELSLEILEYLDSRQNNYEIAIMNFLNIDGSYSLLGKYLSEELYTNFYRNKSDNIIIIERNRIDQIIDEWELIQSGMINESAAVDIGEMLGADAIVTGSLTSMGGNSVRVNARVISISSGAVIGTASNTIRSQEAMRLYNSE